MEEPTKEYLKGFNNGYLLGKHEPELYKSLTASLIKESDYFKGMLAGKKEYDREALLEQLKQSQQINKPKRPELGL